MQLSKCLSSSSHLISEGIFENIAFATEKNQDRFLTFLEKEKFLPALDNPRISCVIVSEELVSKVPDHIKGIAVSKAPKAELFEIHNKLSENPEYTGEIFQTVVGDNCSISPLAYIDAHNVKIGNNVTIEPFVVVKGRVSIGDNVIIRAGTVVGAKGFSFSHGLSGELVPVIDTAKIIIENNVELFEQVSITTGIFPWEETHIGAYTKIDGQCFIAHGTHIGKECMLAGGCKCCGNCEIGNNVWIGPGAVVSNRISAEDNSRISIGAIVTKDVPKGETVSGNFAISHARFLKNLKDSVKDNS